ncbi:Citrate synthase 1 [Nymphon striatum]|nr:Citrate synthase 1 [Nymphon striatum]
MMPLKTCKAGGMGDVVRDVPREISKRGDKVQVVVPSYSRLHQNGRFIANIEFRLRSTIYKAELYEVAPKKEYKNIKHYVIHHPEIEEGGIAHIYHDDPTEPFYTDAIKYFIFCTAVAEGIKMGAFGDIDIVHTHDWHTSPLLFLKTYHPAYKDLKKMRYVYTIHNLAIQGIRPFHDNYASVSNFFPEVELNYKALADSRYTNCINLMAVGIRLADAVHTVSPSYKEDVMLPSRRPEFIGGENLEKDLQNADNEGRLFGILNASNYGNIREAETGLALSLFEPCGISQMLAMRNGNPCLVHHTGGLKDTVKHMKTGFSFGGKTYNAQIKDMIADLTTIDPGYKNTGSCESAITFLDGEKGILSYRGYSIEELAEKADFLEVCYLLIFGELPNKEQLAAFHVDIKNESHVDEEMKKILDAFPKSAHPMGVLSSLTSALIAFNPVSVNVTSADEMYGAIVRILAKFPVLVSWTMRKQKGTSFRLW